MEKNSDTSNANNMSKTINAIEASNTSNTNNAKIAIIAIAAIIFLVSAVLTAYFLMRPQPIEGAKNIHVQITVGGETVRTLEINTDALFLKEALDEANLIDGTDSGFGFWVTSVNGRIADDANQEWWALYKNDEFSMTGVDSTPIEDGDWFEYRLTVGYDDADW